MYYEQPKAVWTKASSICIEPKHFHCTRSWNLLKCWINRFLQCGFFSQNNLLLTETLKKAIPYTFLATSEKHPTDFYSPSNRNWFIPYIVLRASLHDHLLKSAPLFATDCFVDAFDELFGFPCYIFTQCRIYFFTFLFLQKVLTFLLKYHTSASTKYTLHENVSMQVFLHGSRISNFTSSKMITDLHDAALCSCQRKTIQHLDEPPDVSSKNWTWKTENNSVTENPDLMPQINGIIEMSSSVFLTMANQNNWTWVFYHSSFTSSAKHKSINCKLPSG